MSQTAERITLERVLDPLAECLTREVAERIANLRAEPDVQLRVEYLAERCNEGELTPDEHDEYASYVRASHVIAILQAKARKLLARSPNS